MTDHSTNIDPQENEEARIMREQGNTTDPQEGEKEGNVLGGLFDKVFGDSHGDNSLSQDEANDPDKQGSIKK